MCALVQVYASSGRAMACFVSLEHTIQGHLLHSSRVCDDMVLHSTESVNNGVMTGKINMLFTGVYVAVLKCRFPSTVFITLPHPISTARGSPVLILRHPLMVNNCTYSPIPHPHSQGISRDM